MKGVYTGNKPGMRKVDEFIAFIREMMEMLQQEMDLSPNNKRVASMTQRLSHQLRSGYSPEEIQSVLSNDYIRLIQRKLQHKLSEAEFLAELNDARHIGQSEGPVLERVARLPVWNTYRALVGEELNVLRRSNLLHGRGANMPIVFVGSGPMPLSPIMFHLFGEMNVVCLELNSEAYEASGLLLSRLGLESDVSVQLMNGAEFDYNPYGLILVASLVGNKAAVLEQISRTSSHPIVAVRTAEGMNRIMYEAIDESMLEGQGWSVAARTLPDKKLVINSTLFLERKVAE